MKDPALWIAIASAVASCSAALFAFWSIKIAQRSFRLSEDQANSRLPNIVTYLMDGMVRRFDESEKRLYAFSISLSNRSDSDNSLSALELRMIYTVENSVPSNVLLPHTPNLSHNFGLKGAKPITIPIHINAHGTIAGWAFFEIDNSLLKQATINKYEIRFLDAHGKESSIEPIILREIFDEESLAQN